jgi:uncharacterized lipoprotein YddW (UPF0748 family)
MRRLIIIIILFILVVFLNIVNEVEKKEIRAIFISYIELHEYISDDVSRSKDNILKMINNINDLKLNTIILQVRDNCNSVYKSSLFPNTYKFDVLDYFIKESSKRNIKVIAWINPYRVRTTNNIESIDNNELIYKYINTDYLYINNGIYLNPSKSEVEDLVVDGVREVLDYNVDGVLFDDYFYPDSEIDNLDYYNYIDNNEYISKEDYQLNIVSKMIRRVHDECKKKNISFGVSPDGNIDNNYNSHKADVKLWMKDTGYIDFIMPQIYYGFYNSTKGYTNVIHEWEDLLRNDIDLYVALAFYKVGVEDKYAKDGRDEWILNDNIIMREVLLSRNLKNYKGFSLFRYDNLFESSYYTNNSIGEIDNLKKIIK